MATITALNQTAETEGHDHDQCRALGQILDRVGDKWTVMVVGILARGPLRFNAIQREIGAVSHRMLTLTLRALERDGMVTRTAFATIPPKVEYALTPLGCSLIEPLHTLSAWAVANQPMIDNARKRFDQAARGLEPANG